MSKPIKHNQLRLRTDRLGGLPVIGPLISILTVGLVESSQGLWARVIATVAIAILMVAKTRSLHRMIRLETVVWTLFLAVLWYDQQFVFHMMVLPAILVPAAIAHTMGCSLRKEHVPVIAQIVVALYRQAGYTPDAPVLRYARRLTWIWTILLSAIAAIHFTGWLSIAWHGLLQQLGIVLWVDLSDHWSWWTLDVFLYGLMGFFFIGEYILRQHVLADQPYRNFTDFVHQMIRLGTQFWKNLVRR